MLITEHGLHLIGARVPTQCTLSIIFCYGSVYRYQPRRKDVSFEGYIYTKVRDSANGFQFWRCQNSVVVQKENNHPPNAAHADHRLISYCMNEEKAEMRAPPSSYDDQLEALIAKSRTLWMCFKLFA